MVAKRVIVALLSLFIATQIFAAPVVQQGLIDLSDWDWESEGPIALDGDYEFYWKAQLDSADFRHREKGVVDYIHVPGAWNGKVVNGKPIEGFGYATYRLDVLVTRRLPLALKLPDFGTADKVIVDGKELFKAGEPGTDADNTIAKYKPGIVEFMPRGNRVEIIIQISNFDHRLGGAWLPIMMGTPKQLEELRDHQLARDLILFGAIFIIGLYNLVLFGLQTENRSSLYLGLFCVLLATRQLMVGDRFVALTFEDIPFQWYVKIEYLGWYLAGSAFVAFMHSLFPKEFHRYATWTLHGIFGMGALAILLTPVYIYSHSAPFFQVMTIIALVYGLFGLGLATRRKREGALILLFAYALLFCAIVSDILVNAGLSTNILVLDLGLFVFILLQSILISYRFTSSFKTIEAQRSQLAATNLKLRTQEKLRREAETESDALNKRIVQSEKMEAIGLLAGGVAHDLNNILSTTVAYPELALLDLPEDSPLAQPLERTRQAGLRAAAVIQDMLTLARRGVVQREIINANDVVAEYIGSVEYQMMLTNTPGISISTDLDFDLNNVEGSSVHLQKLLMNLVTNSVEAQNGEGKIYISTQNEQTTARDLFYMKISAGDYVVLSIEDEGTGIDPKDLDKLFEPFYTTKVMGQSGTGLGMSVVWGVVYDHKGAIDVVSTPGVGTRFDIYLPASDKKAKPKLPLEPIANLIGDRQKIIVIDDLNEQRELTKAVLQRLNYEVVTFASGEDAVDYLGEHDADLAIIDMVIDTGWDGLRTFEEIIKVKPDIKSILISGFAETDQVLEAQNMGAGPFQRKPFTIESLGLKVRDTLAGD